MVDVKRWCDCQQCEASGRVFRPLKGAGIQATERCGACWGSGMVLRFMTNDEKRVMAKQILEETA